MNQVVTSEYRSPVGELFIGEFNGQICLCDWTYRKQRDQVDSRIKKGLDAIFIPGETDLIKELKLQLDSYFLGDLKYFDIPLLFVGTDFQKSVWNQLITIEYGATLSYQKLTDSLGDSKAIRAVATANGANAISILVPCHRIIGSDGSLTGYAGGLKAKEQLLRLEGAPIYNQQSLF